MNLTGLSFTLTIMILCEVVDCVGVNISQQNDILAILATLSVFSAFAL